MKRFLIIGAGLSGLSAAITLAERGLPCALFSLQPSERAQSVLAEGGINAALNTMHEDDSPAEHFADTVRGGCGLADPEAVRGLTEHAPEILRRLERCGVPFHMQNGTLMLRNFGGQKKKRTAYARSSTGKMIMTALIDEARKYEAAGLIHRFPHHEFLRLLLRADKSCAGVRCRDCYTGEIRDYFGAVLLCCGGMNGLFPEMTTGTTQNSGDAAAAVFMQGVPFGNPEMLQYHPTTVGISGKRCLVSEAARGEGGRLFIEKNGARWYFMEELYPELGNLMPRDVVAREMFRVRQSPGCGGQVYLDLTGLSAETWAQKLSDLREELIAYLSLDPKREPVPVKEGIHYFMGGIAVDAKHRAGLRGLYAAGECACQYHGANRLGGNSMLGALYGGKTAAETAAAEAQDAEPDCPVQEDEPLLTPADPRLILQIRDILLSGLGIVRDETTLQGALQSLAELSAARESNAREKARLCLAGAMLQAALERRESRGAHYRADFPQSDEAYRKTTVVCCENGAASVKFVPLPEEGASV
ncbi:MAG: FAD-binding protein [Oscillospiraceae bacterium]|nr:FAD-binding protein [Oscillospiraceae bacterium]